MLRRFEMYGFRGGVAEAAVAELAGILRDCGRFIPQVLDSAVGRNLSETGVSLVWEHAYESAADYDAYMCHPYHICVLDRYLLPDSAERIIRNDRLGLGLVGYEIDAPSYRRRAGLRRLVLLRARAGAEREVAALDEELAGGAARVAELELSLVAPNSMGAEWFPEGWTHVWEQAFASGAALRAYLAGDSALAERERAWRAGTDAAVERVVDVFYELEPSAP